MNWDKARIVTQILFIAFVFLLSGCASNDQNALFKKMFHSSKGIENAGNEMVSETPSGPLDDGHEIRSPLDLIKDARKLCEKANSEWKNGKTETAIIILDRAYGIMLGIKEKGNPEVAQAKKSLRLTISKRLQEIQSSQVTGVKSEHSPFLMDMNSLVEQEIKRFQGPERRFFLESYKRSGRFRPEIVDALKREGLPEELSWLPLIESGYKVKALSHSRALGLWQFIPSTGYKFGLSRDRWVDERMDPQESTEAAILYLKRLHELFGDWITALAAYNCGEGKVLKKIRQQKINYLDNFWDLYQHLPSETSRYVPRFLALLHILADPERYGFYDLGLPEEPIKFETVEIEKQVTLKSVASKLNISCDLLEELNPQLRRNVTPNKRFALKVPQGYSEMFISSIDEIPEYRVSQERHRHRKFLPWGKYKVRKGDSLYKIARRAGVKMGDLIKVNKLASTRLSIGQVLVIPGQENITEKNRIYKVKPGDNPYIIAKRYKIRLSAFLRANNLGKRSVLHPGQELLIP